MTIHKATIITWALTTTNKYQFMVSESFGFTGPYICWAVLWNYVEHLESGLLVDYHNYQGLSKCYDGNSDNHHFSSRKKKEGKLDFMEYSRYFQDLLYPSHANSKRQRKFELFNPSQAMLEELSMRSSLRSSTGKVQQFSLTQWLHNHTSCTCAALQWQRSSGRGAAQRSSRHAAAVGRLRSISLVCVLHNTITLTLTAVRTVKLDTSPQECGQTVAVPKFL